MVSRKEFFQQSFRMLLGAVARVADSDAPAVAAESTRLFPPGAVDDYPAACTSCGDCVTACPVHAIVLAPDERSENPLAVIAPASQACVMCEDLPCIQACDDGALLMPPVEEGEKVPFPDIGVARVQESRCLAFNGSLCMICFDACPLKRSALRLHRARPVINEDVCTGCGQCEFLCPTPKKAILIEPL